MDLEFMKKNEPDFKLLVDVLKGVRNVPRVLVAELLIDEEIKERTLIDYLDDIYNPPPIPEWGDKKFNLKAYLKKKQAYKEYYRSTINFYRKMGYSLIADLTFIKNFNSLNTIIVKTTNDMNPKSWTQTYLS